jgi:hypothetical protein
MRLTAQYMLDAEIVEYYRNNGVDPEAANDLLEWGIDESAFQTAYDTVDGFSRVMNDEDGGKTGEETDNSEESGPNQEPDDENSYQLEETPVKTRLRQTSWSKDQAYGLEIAHSSNTIMPISETVYRLILTNENYANAVTGETMNGSDSWSYRDEAVVTYRRMNRPAEEWGRLKEASESTSEQESDGD